MSSLHQIQSDFAAALLAADGSLPPELEAHLSPFAPAPQQRRFAIYRNNMHASLIAALAARFPVVQCLLGEEFFRAMARCFILQHPPSGPVLAEYGAGLADFMAAFEPLCDLPYLPDMARLEWLRQRAYHAADAAIADLAALAALPTERLARLRLRLHPATYWLASDYPVLSIWQAHQGEEVPPTLTTEQAEAVLVTRPDLHLLITALPPGGAAFLAALHQGADLAAAAEQADAALPPILATLFNAGAIASLA